MNPLEAYLKEIFAPTCGFTMADQGVDTRSSQDYLGHRDIRHTVIYTAANPASFERLWR
jgi:type 1 fimbriae regulatory protein FimB